MKYNDLINYPVLYQLYIFKIFCDLYSTHLWIIKQIRDYITTKYIYSIYALQIHTLSNIPDCAHILYSMSHHSTSDSASLSHRKCTAFNNRAECKIQISKDQLSLQSPFRAHLFFDILCLYLCLRDSMHCGSNDRIYTPSVCQKKLYKNTFGRIAFECG